MKTIHFLQLSLACAATVSTGRAADLKLAKITQAVNDVQIISAANSSQKSAAVNDVFAMPDILQTGVASRAELVADDETVTRVGANTIFSFDPANRTIDLKQGSLLFHSPHGKGGGTIHTGSATASVLGTTLIVTTTRDGGMKVLDLEGRVDVNTSHKKRQKLQPGQMTFILPGGNELAPIIVFRLDELVRHSLLVRGFDQPLASLPLIQNQVDHQVKLIKSGRASDTGLLVGDKATTTQVEVLDPNTIQTIQNGIFDQGLQLALSADADINTPSLTDAGIPTPPDRLFLSRPFTLAGNPFFAGQSFLGFAGHNISFNSANPLAVNMGPFAADPEFDFVAAGNLNFNGSVSFNGLSAANQLSFIGGNGITFSPGIAVQADAGAFNLATPGDVAMDNVIVRNNIGKVSLISGSTITMNNSFVLGPLGFTLSAPKAINLSWDGSARSEAFDPTTSSGNVINYPNGGPDVQPGLYGSLKNSILTDAADGQVTLTAKTGTLEVSSTSFRAHDLTLNAAHNMLVYAAYQTFSAKGPGSSANFNAGFTTGYALTMSVADLSDFSAVNMAANTLNLTDVKFPKGSQVSLKSMLGMLNVGSSVPGDVNFIKDVTYGGNPAQNYVNNGGGITVAKLH